MREYYNLRILGHVVSVTPIYNRLHGDNTHGESDDSDGTIRIRGDLEPSIYQATLLHEVVHLIDDFLGLGLTEAQVTGISQGLFATIRDNGNFLTVITKEK